MSDARLHAKKQREGNIMLSEENINNSVVVSIQTLYAPLGANY
jgi:hypothetical protein